MNSIKLSREGGDFCVSIGKESAHFGWLEIRQLLEDIARLIAEYDKEANDECEENTPSDVEYQTERNVALAAAGARAIRLADMLLNRAAKEENKIPIEGELRMIIEAIAGFAFGDGEAFEFQRNNKTKGE